MRLMQNVLGVMPRVANTSKDQCEQEVQTDSPEIPSLGSFEKVLDNIGDDWTQVDAETTQAFVDDNLRLYSSQTIDAPMRPVLINAQILERNSELEVQISNLQLRNEELENLLLAARVKDEPKVCLGIPVRL